MAVLQGREIGGAAAVDGHAGRDGVAAAIAERDDPGRVRVEAGDGETNRGLAGRADQRRGRLDRKVAPPISAVLSAG